MNYKQIIPATDWYFRHFTEQKDYPIVVYPLAAWALNEEGKVVGLVAVYDPAEVKAKLVTPPPLKGNYLHRDQLTEEELAASKKQ
ncbi:Methionyl-tRNA formyltransferase [Enterobacterales bacterium 8AC]|nr:Methionyl-tRNA formyltransferase [Enterobacterales bacterium 8AC]